MNKIIALFILIPTVVFADGIKVNESLRTMVSDGQYASRVENAISVAIGPVYGSDIFDWSRTGITKVSSTKTVPHNFGNNEFTIGTNLYNGFGLAAQRSDYFGIDKDAVNRIGLSYVGQYERWGVRANLNSLFLGTNDSYYFRQHNYVVMRAPALRLFIIDRFIWELGDTYQLNNKLTAGVYLTKNAALVVQRQDITGKPSDNRAGIQLTFGFGG